MADALALATRDVRTVDVGGVRTLWAPGDGPAVARLQFRVGQADERLPIRGITHLVEHLAFERVGQPTYSHNGAVSMDTTSFEVAGTPAEVTEFLRIITAGLHNPPAQRLDAERHLLKVEAQRRGGVFDDLAAARYGARGHGLTAYAELGLEHLQVSDLQAWARRWFTADNAVLWLWGADPSAIELALPRGQRVPVPPLEPRRLPPRSWVSFGDRGAALTFFTDADRGIAHAASWWLQRHLTRALRHQAGLAYSVSVEQRLVGDRRLFSVGVDGMPDRSVQLRDALCQALESLKTASVAEDEVAAWKREALEHLTGTDRADEMGRLDLAATGLLLTGVATRAEDVIEQCEAVTAEAIVAALGRWHETCVLAVPEGVGMPSGWTVIDRLSGASVKAGQVFAPAVRALEGQRLLVSQEGITNEYSAHVRRTVRWDDCAAVLTYADGSLAAIGHDGVGLQLLPSDWVGGEQLLAQLAHRIDPSLVVPMDSKPSDHVVTGLSGLVALSTGLLTTLVVACWLSALMILSLLSEPESGTGAVVGVGVFVALSLGATWALIARLRAPKERRVLPKESICTATRVRAWMARQSDTTLLSLEAFAWTLTVVVAAALVVRASPWPALILAGLAVRLRRERHRVEARRPGAKRR